MKRDKTLREYRQFFAESQRGTDKNKPPPAGTHPIYFDASSGYYYYPMEAVEEPYQRYRETLGLQGNMMLDPVSKLYMDRNTKERYIRLQSEQEFKEKRLKGITGSKLEDMRQRAGVEVQNMEDQDGKIVRKGIEEVTARSHNSRKEVGFNALENFGKEQLRKQAHKIIDMKESQGVGRLSKDKVSVGRVRTVNFYGQQFLSLIKCEIRISIILKLKF